MSLITRSRTVHAIAQTATYFYGVNEKNQTVAVPASSVQGGVVPGAVGDGITDDTAAIQAAITAAAGSALVLLSGSTFLSGPLTISSAMTLRIDGTLKMKDSTGVLLTVTASSGFELTGTGTIDLNDTEYIGVKISASAAPKISGSLTIKNMTGGAASTGNSGALEIINCSRPKVRGLRITDILHGTASGDSQPRSITLDTCTDADIEATCDAVNSAVVAASCTGARLSVAVDGGGVTNDNAFYLIGCTDTIIRSDTREWTGEPIVDSGSTDTLILGGSQIDCAGNANGFEDCDGLTFQGTLFRGANVSGILKSRTGNTSSTNVRLINCTLLVSSTEEIVSFFNGAVVDFTMTGTRWVVKYDTSKAFGNKFLRLADTTRFVIEDNVIVFDDVAAAPAEDFTLDLDCSEYSSFKRNRLFNRTTSGRFRVNNVTTNVATDDLHKQANIDALRDSAYGLTGAEPRNMWGTSAPSAGTFRVGDRVWGTATAAGGTMGWVCTTAGTPGTWKTFGAIAA
jgi:polygalacturonase